MIVLNANTRILIGAIHARCLMRMVAVVIFVRLVATVLTLILRTSNEYEIDSSRKQKHRPLFIC